MTNSCFIDVTNWRANDYVADLTERATGQNAKVEKGLLKKYPPIFSSNKYQMQPCIVKDKDGYIMMWYIPGAVTAQRTVSLWFVHSNVRCCQGPRIDADLARPNIVGEVIAYKQVMQ